MKRKSLSMPRNQAPLNAPEYFTKQINKCRDMLMELRRLSRDRDSDLHFLLKRLDTCGALYNQLVDISIRDNITWRYYKYQHQDIERCLTHISENLEFKKHVQQIQKDKGFFGWLKGFARIVTIADTAFQAVGMRPFASYACNAFINIVNRFTGKNYSLLGNDEPPRRLL